MFFELFTHVLKVLPYFLFSVSCFWIGWLHCVGLCAGWSCRGYFKVQNNKQMHSLQKRKKNTIQTINTIKKHNFNQNIYFPYLQAFILTQVQKKQYTVSASFTVQIKKGIWFLYEKIE